MITLCEFDNPDDAHLARIFLANHKIESMVQNEIGARYGESGVFVSLAVNENDQNEALLLLKTWKKNRFGSTSRSNPWHFHLIIIGSLIGLFILVVIAIFIQRILL
jgi:hypothetical protein